MCNTNEKSRVLLLGGTGAMGSHLVRVLASAGMDVTVTTRRDYPDAGLVHYVKGDAHDMAFLRPLLAGQFDAIVDFMVYDTEEFRLRYREMLAATRQYVFLSSARVYAGSYESITEDTPRLLEVCEDEEYLKTDEYALSKARQEDLLRESGSTNWTIVRPYITFSEIRLQLGVLEKEQWLWRALHGRTIVFSKDIAGHYTTLTYGLNVAQGIAALVGQSSACGKAFHITGTEAFLWSEILEIYVEVLAETTGRRPKILLLDRAVNLRYPRAQYQVRYDRLYDRRFDNSGIGRYTDVSLFLPVREGLKSCVREFVGHPRFSAISVRREALYDRMTGEWAPPREIPSFKEWMKYLIFRTVYPKSKL